jgi:3-keto-5-aminohexanoate cleavage enzyme
LDKLIIQAALGNPGTAGAARPGIASNWEEFVEDAVAVRAAGASITRFHGPSDANGKINPDGWGKLAEQVRKASGLLLDFGQADAPMDQRKPLMELGAAKPDFMGVSLTGHDDHSNGKDTYHGQPRSTLVGYAESLKSNGIKPTWDIWHAGGLWNLEFLGSRGLIEAPHWLNLHFGAQGGSWSPSSLDEISNRVRQLPADCRYLVAPRVGLEGVEHQTRMLAFAILLGGHVRVGAQDTREFASGTRVTSSAQLISRIARLARELGRDVATPPEARVILGLA